jgi:hypothetical protein
MNSLGKNMRRGLAWGLGAALVVPWLIGQWVKTTLQPGIADGADSAALLVDYIVIGAIVFGLSLWLVAACACVIVFVMKGPRYHGDAFPPEQPRGTP